MFFLCVFWGGRCQGNNDRVMTSLKYLSLTLTYESFRNQQTLKLKQWTSAVSTLGLTVDGSIPLRFSLFHLEMHQSQVLVSYLPVFTSKQKSFSHQSVLHIAGGIIQTLEEDAVSLVSTEWSRVRRVDC